METIRTPRQCSSRSGKTTWTEYDITYRKLGDCFNFYWKTLDEAIAYAEKHRLYDATVYKEMAVTRQARDVKTIMRAECDC